jgi:hypothetical protein
MLIMWLDPNIVRGAKTGPMMARGAQILRSWAPAEVANGLPSDLQLPPPDNASDTKQDAAPKPTYNQRANDDMQRLIDTTSRK